MDKVVPLRRPEFPIEGNARVSLLAKRLGVRPRNPAECAVGMPGEHGEYYDMCEMLHTLVDRIEGENA